MAKKLTLQINRPSFQDILNGVQHVEHRFIYPSNANRYVIQTEIEEGLDIQCVQYDELYLINGRRKEAPRLTVNVDRTDFVPFVDEDGNDLVEVGEDGIEYIVCQVWYHLGKVTATENVPEDYYYDASTKAERLRMFKKIEDEMDQSLI